MTNSNNDSRVMSLARSYTEEADYYEFEVLPHIPYGEIYRARLKHMITTRREEAIRLELKEKMNR